MLDECLEFLETRSSSYEVKRYYMQRTAHFDYSQVIIVDDGSKDGTTSVGLDYVDKFGCDKVEVSFGNILHKSSWSGASADPW